MLAGIKDIVIVGKNEYIKSAKKILKNGSQLGIDITYSTNMQEVFNNENASMVVNSEVFLYGPNLTRYFQRAISNNKGITCLAIPETKNKERIYFDNFHEIKKHYSMNMSYNKIPILFYEKSKIYNLCETEQEKIIKMAEPLGRGMVYKRITTWQDVNDISNFIHFIEENSGEYVYSVEEIAWNRGMISKKQLHKLADRNTIYGQYLLSI